MNVLEISRMLHKEYFYVLETLKLMLWESEALWLIMRMIMEDD